MVPWSQTGAAWHTYDAAVAVGAWEYTSKLEGFVDAIGRIADAGCALWNPYPLLRWNLDKTYLGDLKNKGVPIVSTHFLPSIHERDDFEVGLDDFYTLWYKVLAEGRP